MNTGGNKGSGDREPLFLRKVFFREPSGCFRMREEDPPLRFDDLNDQDFLTTRDLKRYFNIGWRTVWRWIAEHGLAPDCRYKQELLFYKSTVLRWERADRPKIGRPRKDERKAAGYRANKTINA
jgi:hypothetical protein